jgi:hypothetical protein
MATTEYVSEGTLEVPSRDFNNWLISYLPVGPMYAVSTPVFPDAETLKVAFRASTVAQPNPPLPPP